MHLPTRNPLNDENYKVLKMKKTKRVKITGSGLATTSSWRKRRGKVDVVKELDMYEIWIFFQRMSGAQSKLSPLLKFLPKKIQSQLDKPVVSVLRLHGTISAQKGKKYINLENTRKQIDKVLMLLKSLHQCWLVLHSPGGSPVQSDGVTSYIQMKSSKQNVPVAVFVEDMAANM